MDLSTTIPGATPFGVGRLDPSQNAPAAPSAWALSEQRLEREKRATTADYVRSIWRQDGLVDGLVATHVGNEMLPQPGYFAGTDPAWKDLSKGLWDEHVKELYAASSPAHAMFLRERLMQKQEDLTRLGDMGMSGTVGRLALNVLSPDALLMGMAGGWVTRGAIAVQGARATRLGKAVANAERVQRAGKAPAIAGGIAFGTAENVAYEALRQSVNFEDDTAALAEAGLMGAVFTTPFALAGARSASRVAKAAKREHDTLVAMKKVEDGKELTPAEAQNMREVVETHRAIRDLEAGRIDEAEFEARMGEFHGPVEPPEVWMKRYGERLRRETQEFIDEVFPSANARAAGRRAPSEPELRRMDEAVDLETKVNFPESTAAANAANPPLEGAMSSAFKRTLKNREAVRKALDLEDLDAARGAAAKAEREAQWEAAMKDAAARRAAEEEAMVRAGHLAMADDPFDVPAPVRAADPEAAPPAPEADPAAPVEPPAPAPAGSRAEDWVGQEVSFAHPRTGETVEGRVKRVSPTGKLVVEDAYTGQMVAVEHTALDQHATARADLPEGFLPGSIGAAQVGRILTVMEARTAMSKARLDYYATLDRSENELVRDLNHRLSKDAIQSDDQFAQAETASEYKRQLQRTVGGEFHRVAREAYREAVAAAGVPLLQRGQFRSDFYELVSQVTRGDQRVLADNPAIAPMLQKAAAAQKKAYARMLDEMQKAGVLGADQVPANDLYVNRLWDHVKLREAIATHGRAKVVELVANAIRVPGLTGDLTRAERFLTTVQKLEHSAALQSVHLQGRDMGTLRTLLEAHGMAKADIDDLVDVMFDARAAADSDAGQASRLKFRFDLDENARTVSPAGELRMSDLFENDARVLVDTYVNSMAGHVGLARKGIKSQADWQAELKRISDEAVAKGHDGKRIERELGLLNDIHSHIVGRPMSTADFSRTARAAQALRGYTRSVMLGQLGLTAAFEMNRAIGMMGFKAVWQSVPSFRSFITALRQGYIPDPGLADDVMAMTGFGNEMASSYARAQELEGGYVGGALSRFERGANTVSHVSDVISGNASFTSVTRQVAAMAATRQAFAFATGGKKLTAAVRRRWVAQGVDDMDIDDMLRDLKTYSTHRSGVLETIDYEKWQAESPDLYDRFRLFVSRQTREAIQDQDIGETMPFMHTTLGKVLSELRTFMLVAHAKQFLKNLHFRDAAALQAWTVAFVAECMSYSLQSAINAPSELDERLQPERIVAAALSRMSVNGVMPLLMETAYNVATGGDTLLAPGSTANTDSRVLWKTPSYIVATRLWGLPMNVSGALGTDTVTQKEALDSFRALPFTRLYGLPAVSQFFADSLPKSDPEKSDR